MQLEIFMVELEYGKSDSCGKSDEGSSEIDSNSDSFDSEKECHQWGEMLWVGGDGDGNVGDWWQKFEK